MDANGTRYHLLLGAADWQGCTWSDDGLQWQHIDALPATPVEWVDASAELMLRRRPFVFDAAVGDHRPDLDRDRRGVAADRFGNWYCVNAAADGVRVRSAGSHRSSDFWPVPDLAPASGGGSTFAPAQAAVEPPRQLAGAAVTTDHFLVVGSVRPAGVLVFDLYAGGPPRQLLWPTGVAFEPYAIAAAPAGGVWILDRGQRRLWQLDRHFELARVPAAAHAPAPTFQPGGGSPLLQQNGMAVADPVLLPGSDPIALATAADGSVFVLDRGQPGDDAALIVVRGGQRVQRLSTAAMRALVAGGDGFAIAAYDMAYVATNGRLTVAHADGNQCFAFALQADAQGAWALTPLPDYLPMRRFGGKGLAASAGLAWYDFAESWVPLARRPQPRHVPAAWLRTRAFDSREPQCVWHRLFIDATIPPDARVQVWSRAADDEANLDGCAWQQEPPLYRRADGSELPFRERAPAPLRQGEGTWELLLQRARGRHLHLRLRLEGNERHSPRLSALRVHYPRFSYLEKYLPAMYRDDADSAAFLDGFLANIEGFYTTLEDRIAAAGVLLDWRSAPAEALAWLAGWLGVALDPAWDAPRQRLFIRHAMLFFQYRGTAHGLRLALSLALDDTLDETRFDVPERVADNRFGVRLIERYRTRRLPDVLFGDTRQLQSRALLDARPWRPADGGSALRERYAQALGVEVSTVAEFPLVVPADEATAALWTSFCESVLGFAPFDAGLERQAWQDALAAAFGDIDTLNTAWRSAYNTFDEIVQPARPEHDDWARHMRNPAPARTPVERLAWQAFVHSRYATATRLNAAWGSEWPAFDLVPVPDRLPGDGAALDDWFQFESTVLAMRATAHRFTVLLPMPAGEAATPDLPQRRLDLARRIVTLEKPAHTVFDLRYYWAMFRVGEARLGLDTVLDEGVRDRLMSPLVLGRGHLGQDYVAPTPLQAQHDRRVVGRDRLESGDLR
jgi:phage tail-like protein